MWWIPEISPDERPNQRKKVRAQRSVNSFGPRIAWTGSYFEHNKLIELLDVLSRCAQMDFLCQIARSKISLNMSVPQRMRHHSWRFILLDLARTSFLFLRAHDGKDSVAFWQHTWRFRFKQFYSFTRFSFGLSGWMWREMRRWSPLKSAAAGDVWCWCPSRIPSTTSSPSEVKQVKCRSSVEAKAKKEVGRGKSSKVLKKKPAHNAS